MFATTSQAGSQKLLLLTEHSPPYQFVSKSNKVEGLTTKVIQEALKLTPYQYKMKIYPWSRSFFWRRRKKIDVFT